MLHWIYWASLGVRDRSIVIDNDIEICVVFCITNSQFTNIRFTLYWWTHGESKNNKTLRNAASFFFYSFFPFFILCFHLNGDSFFLLPIKHWTTFARSVQFWILILCKVHTFFFSMDMNRFAWFKIIISVTHRNILLQIEHEIGTNET